MVRTLPAARVACGSCSLCCHGQDVVLHPEFGDDPSTYVTRPGVDPTNGGIAVLLLARKANGDCHYLEAGRCSIHDHRPSICATFSCVDWFRRKTRAERRRIERVAPGAKALFARGRQLLEGGV